MSWENVFGLDGSVVKRGKAGGAEGPEQIQRERDSGGSGKGE